MSNFLSYFKHEMFSRLFSSKKKIVKFVSICLVPFLYGFICVWAFWNPVGNVGNVPMAIVDNSQRIDLAVGIDEQQKVIVGQAAELDANNIPISIVNPTDENAPILLSRCLIFKPDYSFVEGFLDGWTHTHVKNPLISRNPNGTFIIKIAESSPLRNVSYFNDKTSIKASDIAIYNPDMKNPISGGTGAWEVKDESYWMQIQIPTDFNYVFAKTLTGAYQASTQPGLDFSWTSSLDELSDEPINIWTTFKKNFLFGQFMKIFQEFKDFLYIDFFPELLVQTLSNILSSVSQNLVNTYHNELFFKPESNITVNNVNANFHIGSKEESTSSYSGNVSFIAGEEYLIRNNEIRDAIYNAISLDPNVSENDKNKLKTIYTYEGNTSQLVATQNDWVIQEGDLSFLNLTTMLIRPLVSTIVPSAASNDLNSSSNIVKKFLSNKMFLTAMFEKDGNVFPKTPIQNLLVDNMLIKLINDLPSSNYAIIFSNNTANKDVMNSPLSVNKIAITSSEWSVYTSKLSGTINSIIGSILQNNNIQYQANAPPVDINKIITSGVIGSQFSDYGIGLGQFFLFIGIWVGVLMQTFMLDRRRRGPAALKNNYQSKPKKVTRWTRIKESLQWYFSKTSMMLFITFFQVTILTITVAAIGWWEIGPPFGLVYLQLLFSGVVFTLFIQSLWFLFRDEVIGKFIVILFLIINLSSGWGTFPPMMQSKFFEVLSYIAPFTYQIKNVGAIIYGIGVVGSNSSDNLFILQNIGISLIYVVISFVLATFGSLKLTKMQLYGSFNQAKLAKVIIKLMNFQNDYPEYNNNDCGINYADVLVKRKTIWKKLHLDSVLDKPAEYMGINWDKMPQTYCDLICKNFNEQFPYEEKFKWFKKKVPDWKIELEDAKL